MSEITLTPTSILKRTAQRIKWLLVVLINAYLLAVVLYFILRLVLPPEIWWLALASIFTPYYFMGVAAVLVLAILIGARWTAARALPLALVGLFWFAPLFVPQYSAGSSRIADDAPEVSVTTFNILANGRPYTEVVNWFEAQKSRSDIIIMQEVSNDFPLLDEGIQTWNPESTRWGTWVYTRFPVVEVSTLSLAGRTHQRIVIDVDGQLIAVYGVHFTIPFSQPRFNPDIPFGQVVSFWSSYDETGRNGQIDSLLKYLEDEPLPYIVAGDFNMSDQSAKYSEVAAVMTDSFREAGTGLGTSWPMKYVNGIQITPPLIRIDYIWHSEAFQALEVSQGRYVGSDHLPLHATLSLSE